MIDVSTSRCAQFEKMQKLHSKTVVQTVALAVVGVATAVVAYRNYKAIKDKKPKVMPRSMIQIYSVRRPH